MISLAFIRGPRGVRKLSCTGHSGYAERGSDIVCAAISSLVQALDIGLSDVLCIKDIKRDIDPDEPHFKLEWSDQSDKSDILFNTVLISARALEKQYADYVEITERSERQH